MGPKLDLPGRVRALMPKKGVVEKKMFGGICFMLNGNLTFGASWKGLLVRVGKESQAAAVKRPGAEPMVMKGRAMNGYVWVDSAALSDDDDLIAWVKTGVDHVRTLPTKPVKPAKKKIVDDGLPLPPPLEAARKKAKKKVASTKR